MKYLVAILAFAGILVAPAVADSWGGLSGHITDLRTGQPIARATILFYRSTGVTANKPFRLMQMTTNEHGFFSKMPLEPGRYVLMARVPGRVQGCAIDDVIGSETTRVHIVMGYDAVTCSGPRYHPALVNPNSGGDLYII
jgi:hypothetical protein